MENYISVNAYRKNRSGGGVSLCIYNTVKFTRRLDLEYFDAEMESIFIEIDSSIFNTKSNVIIGLIYRMPDSSVEIFIERMDTILNVIHKEKKICYFLGDLNLCFLKCDTHKHTSDFLDMIYTHGVFPLITKPTRVTETSATLIDHILTNNFDIHSHHVQGILCTSISDHYSIFHIATNAQRVAGKHNSGPPKLTRNYTKKNIEKFVNELRNTNWDNIMLLDDVKTAYSTFQSKISHIYDSCFPMKPMSKQYFNNKPWLTPVLKESIKVKNKLYVNRFKGDNPLEKDIYYRRYRNRLNHILNAAERKHFHDLIIQHKSNLKKLGMLLKE